MCPEHEVGDEIAPTARSDTSRDGVNEDVSVCNAKCASDFRAAKKRRVADDRVETWPRWIEDLGKNQGPVQGLPVEGAVWLVFG